MHDSPTARNLHNIIERIRVLEQQYQRTPGSVRLLAVSKTKPAHMITQAAANGQLEFGENYADEGAEKRELLADTPLCWHYIGSIQSNKTKLIAATYDWVQGLDRAKIATRLAKHRPAGLKPLNVCIQVNVDGETSKAGCHLEELDTLAQTITALDALRLRGIMAIPAPRNDLSGQRRVFASLFDSYRQLQAQYQGIDTLSIGMSGDMEAAIAEGSTMVRIGTAIFGQRDYPAKKP